MVKSQEVVRVLIPASDDGSVALETWPGVRDEEECTGGLSFHSTSGMIGEEPVKQLLAMMPQRYPLRCTPLR